MIKIKLLTAFFFLSCLMMFSQENINNYKYIIVPSIYDFQKAEDSFQINSLTKFLFSKSGFTTFLSTDNLPDDLAKNRCLALTANLKNKASMFSTKMSFDLVNCNNTVVFSSIQAASKAKDYKKAYHEVIRETFQDIKAQNYKYTNSVVTPKVVEKESSAVKIRKIVVPKIETATVKEELGMLYAQPINNGFQLVDNTPKKVYVVLETSVENTYVLKDKNGILYKLGDYWIAEYYVNNQLVEMKFKIKF